MKRERKFRVFLDSELIYIKDDLYIAFFNADNAVDWAIYSRKNGNCIYKHDKTYPELYNQNCLDEYTGLKDKNGVEIYEGDIVEQVQMKLIVLFRFGCFFFSSPSIDSGCVMNNGAVDFHEAIHQNIKHGYDINDRFPVTEVIGNIHENADLLK